MIELKFNFKKNDLGQLDLIKLVLLKLGIKENDIVENDEKGKKFISIFLKTQKQTQEVIKRFKLLKLKGVLVLAKDLDDKDWTTRWKDYFKAFNITKNVRIVPLWMKGKDEVKSKKTVYIDTTFAFGSGMHATTQMMAQLIESKKKNLEKFLDIGTGSGILSLIAQKLGAKEIWALDIDPISIETAQDNFKINKCNYKFLRAVRLEKFRTSEKFDFIAANLITEDLIRLKDSLISLIKTGGYLAVSGIFCDNYPKFAKEFRDKQIQVEKVVSRKKWFAVLFKKT